MRNRASHSTQRANEDAEGEWEAEWSARASCLSQCSASSAPSAFKTESSRSRRSRNASTVPAAPVALLSPSLRHFVTSSPLRPPPHRRVVRQVVVKRRDRHAPGLEQLHVGPFLRRVEVQPGAPSNHPEKPKPNEPDVDSKALNTSKAKKSLYGIYETARAWGGGAKPSGLQAPRAGGPIRPANPAQQGPDCPGLWPPRGQWPQKGKSQTPSLLYRTPLSTTPIDSPRHLL